MNLRAVASANVNGMVSIMAFDDNSVRKVDGHGNLSSPVGYWKLEMINGNAVGVCRNPNGGVEGVIENGAIVRVNNQNNNNIQNNNFNNFNNGIGNIANNNGGGLSSGINTGGVGIPSNTNNIGGGLNNASIPTEPAPMSNKPVEEPKKELVAEPLPGYAFMPIPTAYMETVIESLGQYYKYKTTIKTGVNDMDKEKNLKVYDELVNNSKKNTGPLELYDSGYEIDIENSSIHSRVRAMTANTNGKHILLTGSVELGFVDSVIEANSPDNGKDVIATSKENITVRNLLYSAVGSQCNNLFELLDMLNKPGRADLLIPLRRKLASMLKEEITTIDRVVEFDVNNFDTIGASKAITDYIHSIVDTELRARALDGLDRLYKRLTNLTSIRKYNGVGDITETKKNLVINAYGITEDRAVIATECKYITTELVELTLDKQNTYDGVMYKLTTSTPNLYSLVDRFFKGHVTLIDEDGNKGKPYNQDNYSNVHHILELMVVGCVYTVVKADNGTDYILFKKAL